MKKTKSQKILELYKPTSVLVYPSYRQLAKKVGCTIGLVAKVLAKAREKGLIHGG